MKKKLPVRAKGQAVYILEREAMLKKNVILKCAILKQVQDDGGWYQHNALRRIRLIHFYVCSRSGAVVN